MDFLLSNGCRNIIAYPLMFLKGTELYEQKEKYHFQKKHWGILTFQQLQKVINFQKMIG